MDAEQESVNIDQQSGNSAEESTLKNDHDTLCVTASLTASSDKEIEQSTCSNNAEAKENHAPNSNVILNNGVSDQIQTCDSLLTDEHSYANVNNENSSESNGLTNVNNGISNELLNAELILPMDTLDNTISDNSEQNKNCFDIENNDSVPVINNEVVITEEVITIDNNEINKDISNNKKIENKNLSNGTSNDKATEDLYFIDKCTSLGAIAAQYDSSDSEDENNSKSVAKVSNVKDYRINDEVMLSSDESSDSENDSSSSDSESDSDSSSCKSIKSNSDDSDDENVVKKKENSPKKVFKPKNEFDDLPPIEDLKISVPEVLCDPLGEVAWTVEQMVVVRPKPGKPTLNLDTVLFIDKGQRALGHIFDVFGQVAEPHYCVRFNSSDHIQECDVKVGMIVYYCPNTPYTSLVFLSELTKMKATDDLGDDEAPQFSDDEEERTYLANLRNKANNNKTQDTLNERPNKRRRGNKSSWQSNHPWNSNREHQQQNTHPPNHSNPRPFYRTQHPWSRPRYQQQNPWHQYNSFPNNQWVGQYPPYNEVQPYNEYLGPAPVQSVEVQNVRFPQMQWSPHYPLPQVNAVPIQRFPQTLVRPFAIPPPPPPPPNADT